MPLVDLATEIVTGAIAEIDGSARVGDKVKFTLFPGSSIPGVVIPSGRKTATVGADGLLYSGLVDIDDDPIPGVELWANAEGDEPSQYRVQLPSGEVHYFILTEGGETDLAALIALYAGPSAPNYASVVAYADTHLGGRVLSPVPVPATDAVYRWDGDSFEPVTVYSKAQAAALFLPLAGGSLSGTLTLSVLTSPSLFFDQPVGASTPNVIESRQAGDVWNRWVVHREGKMFYGDGASNQDTISGRSAANIFEIGDESNVDHLVVRGSLGVGTDSATIPAYALDVYRPNAAFRLRNSTGSPTILTWREDATPTNGDNLFSWEFFGPDSALAYDRYGYIRADSVAVTAGAKTGSIYFMTAAAGVEAVRFSIIGADVIIDGAAQFAGAATFNKTLTLNVLTSPSLLFDMPVGASTPNIIESRQVGDAFHRWVVSREGKQFFGSGTENQDTIAGRSGPGIFEIGDASNADHLVVRGTLGVGTDSGTSPTYSLDVYRPNAVFRLRSSTGAPTYFSWRENAAPANGDDLFTWEFFGPDSNIAYDRYGYIRAVSDVVTAGGRTGSIFFVTSEAGAEAVRFKIAGNRIGFNNVTPVVRQTVGAAAIDAATNLALTNLLRTALINFGLAIT